MPPSLIKTVGIKQWVKQWRPGTTVAQVEAEVRQLVARHDRMIEAARRGKVEQLAQGMLADKSAHWYAEEYADAHDPDTDADDNAVRADAAKLKRNPAVALALREILRSQRLQDMDSVGELISDTKEDRLAAKDSGAHAAVAAFDRMRGNWLGVEKTTIHLDPVQMLSDEELIQRLAGDDPKRIEAARLLLGAPDHFPDTIEVDFEEVSASGPDQP